MKSLEQQIANAPTEPGVYFMWDEQFECLYIGKSTNLRKRLRSHLEGFEDCERTRAEFDYDDPEMEEFAITRHATHEVHADRNEVAEITTKTYGKVAKLEELEKRFIRALLPKYNVIHNHLVTNPELKLTCAECDNQLSYKKTAGTSGGYVCKTWGCRHYWKLGKGDVVEVVDDE